MSSNKERRYIPVLLEKPMLLKSGRVSVPPFNPKPIILLVFVLLTYWFGILTNFSFVKLANNFGNIVPVVEKLSNPDWSYFETVKGPLLDTIRMSLLGSFIGAAIALPVAFVASANLNANKYVTAFVKLFLSLLRTFPILIYASMLVLVLGFGAFAGTIAIAIFTFSIMTKMLYEYIETIDLGAFHALESSGASKPKAFTAALMPEIFPVFISYALYCFEINVRYSAILGYVGAGGIGFILDFTLKSRGYEKTATILVGLFAVVLIIENLSKYLRRRFN